jgi:alkylhydroperoxidase family enzyme
MTDTHKWRKENPEAARVAARAYEARNAERLKQQRLDRVEAKHAIVDAVRAAGCSRCPEKDPDCLDFHHRDPATKTNSLAKLINGVRRLSVLMEEIAKCDVLCANCHRKLHARERREKGPSGPPTLP